MEPETLVEIEVCPECFGTGFANHYLTEPRNERECWRCKGTGEVATGSLLRRSSWKPTDVTNQ